MNKTWYELHGKYGSGKYWFPDGDNKKTSYTEAVEGLEKKREQIAELKSKVQIVLVKVESQEKELEV